MSDQSNKLNTRLKDAAKKKVGSKALKSKYGIDCFGLVDALLRSVGANSAHDYNDEVPVTARGRLHVGKRDHAGIDPGGGYPSVPKTRG